MRALTRRELAINTADIARRFPAFMVRPYRSLQSTRAYQLRRLQRLVHHAYARVDLYRQKWRDAGVHPNDLRSLRDLESFPTVAKDDVLAAYPQGALARGLDKRGCLVSQSSGSTGQVLPVVHRADRIGLQGLAMNRLLSMHTRYWPWTRFAYVYTSPYPVRSLFGTYPMTFIPTLAPLPELLATLRSVRPNILACYPSHLRELLAHISTDEVSSWGLRAVSLSSEPSTQAERNAFSDQLRCPVYDEYSTEELTRVAAQCHEGHYHLFEDVAYIEVLELDSDAPVSPERQARGETGEVVGTNLENLAMPFIRYRQGDRARISTEPCACGMHFRQLASLAGRALDDFILPSGRILRSGWLLDVSYSFLLDMGADLRAFCMEQETPARIRIDIVAGSAYEPALDQRIANRFIELAGEPIDVIIRRVDEIPRTAAGKHHPIRSRVSRG